MIKIITRDDEFFECSQPVKRYKNEYDQCKKLLAHNDSISLDWWGLGLKLNCLPNSISDDYVNVFMAKSGQEKKAFYIYAFRMEQKKDKYKIFIHDIKLNPIRFEEYLNNSIDTGLKYDN